MSERAGLDRRSERCSCSGDRTDSTCSGDRCSGRVRCSACSGCFFLDARAPIMGAVTLATDTMVALALCIGITSTTEDPASPGRMQPPGTTEVQLLRAGCSHRAPQQQHCDCKGSGGHDRNAAEFGAFDLTLAFDLALAVK